MAPDDQADLGIDVAERQVKHEIDTWGPGALNNVNSILTSDAEWKRYLGDEVPKNLVSAMKEVGQSELFGSVLLSEMQDNHSHLMGQDKLKDQLVARRVLQRVSGAVNEEMSNRAYVTKEQIEGTDDPSKVMGFVVADFLDADADHEKDFLNGPDSHPGVVRLASDNGLSNEEVVQKLNLPQAKEAYKRKASQ